MRLLGVLGGALGGRSGLLDDGLLGDRLADELDDRHRGVVTLAGGDLRDPGVATRAVGHVRRDLDEEAVDDTLVTDDRHDPATGVQVTALGEGDEALGERAQALGLGLGRRDRVVLEERLGEVGEDQALVRRTASEAGTLGGGGHCLLLGITGPEAGSELLVLGVRQVIVVTAEVEVVVGADRAGVEPGRAVLELQAHADELGL